MKSNGECDNLDAYLAGELSADAAQSIVAHLELCADCRENVHEQQWIDGLLRASELAKLEAPAADFTRSLKSTIVKSRQRAGLVACVFAAAAVLLVAVGWLVIRDRAVSPFGDPQRVHIADNHGRDAEQPSIAIAEPIRATVITGRDSLAVPIESPYTDVTIVRIYSTYQAEFTDSSSIGLSSAEGESDWPANTRGGTL